MHIFFLFGLTRWTLKQYDSAIVLQWVEHLFHRTTSMFWAAKMCLQLLLCDFIRYSCHPNTTHNDMLSESFYIQNENINWAVLKNSKLILTLSTLGKICSRRHTEILFLLFPENKIWHFIQIFSNEDNLHEISNPVFWENKKNTCIVNLPPA